MCSLVEPADCIRGFGKSIALGLGLRLAMPGLL
jgi:hypothetical protein